MDRETAQRLRSEIVDFGTKANTIRMTDRQRAEYGSAKRRSRDAMRQINNERADVAPMLGGIENLAENHEIPETAAAAITRAHHVIQTIAAELPE